MPSASGQITLYPANRLEDLALLLEHVLSLNPGSVLAPSTVIVESQGMQHWVSMALAESRGLCMNLDFPMPGVFLWQLVRRLLGPERVPLESPYQREALAWRIDRLLASELCIDDARFDEVTRYWRSETDADVRCDDLLKRFQLASKQADLYEQYLMFRPDWIEAWEQGQSPAGLDDNWQAALWRLLVTENPDHPVRLQREAISALAAHADKLPAQICLFAINTLPPGTLQFFDQLARYTQVHLFHLNPCVAYWGDLQAEKQQAAQRAEQVRRWLACVDPECTDSELSAQPEPAALPGEPGNPLLANLGGQGKEFFAALQGLDSCEISAFDLPPSEPQPDTGGEPPSVLQQIQRDILTLHDARPADPTAVVERQVDDSITLSASHSALRELQALHDWLLHRFNQDQTLTPRDVLVMCPQVEHYAPYISAVFDSGFFASRVEGSDQPPKLPVSITDRAPRDAEPLISSFLELLTLPDSRFQVSRILDLLRLPSLQARFGFSADELSTLQWWLSEAGIHWGLDAGHKANMSGAAESSALFSWDWGLRRLLLGFARSDEAELVDHQWLLPLVEGADAILLGRLMQLLERLQRHARTLVQPRTPQEWGHYLRELRDAFFSPADPGGDERDASDELDKAINQLVSWTALVAYDQPLTLDVVRHYLNHHLGMPDGSNRFMTGQITFCSLEPMRSAPFRVIAILGLNDGEYPRQQVPFGFDLMAQTPRRAGDRSRRGDDRYLFLEALICTREKLYLSYQGADIKNNSERQPSLILTELMDYLQRGYGWRFEPGAELQRQPLHPFSADNFSGDEPGFDHRWQQLSQPRAARDNRIRLDPPEQLLDDDGLQPLELEALVRFFDNPSRAFAEQRLGLRLQSDNPRLDDAEPFDADGLTAFQARELLLGAALGDEPEPASAAVREMLAVSGRLPDSLRAAQFVDSWQQQASTLAAELECAGVETLQVRTAELVLDGVRLRGQLPLVSDGPEERQLLLWRPARTKAKDQWRLWLYHLMAQAAGLTSCSRGIFLGPVDKKTGDAQVETLALGPVADARLLLEQLLVVWREGQCAPLLLNAKLGLTVCAKQYKTSNGVSRPLPGDEQATARLKAWNGEWAVGYYASPYQVGSDPYVSWFWPEGDSLDNWWEQLKPVYDPAVAALLDVAEGEV
ncbi:exodeoxyribonuclease V subunit gamma [Motiliproteus sediminis]|uniref:exodeoxyribonuclease V subunit gamma n=1 Tax=Motiliproteus sediminis TaxID=1468178 RepID=UPI001AF0210A|nr:exodeoxyribonuclease V subunit gamma [Motiliproteus sediminis]